MSNARQRIAIFYYVVMDGNGIGRVTRARLEHLCEDYDFTVFATTFDNPRPDRIRWVKVPCILRPGLIHVVCFRVIASILYFWRHLSMEHGFDLKQSTDASFGLGRIDIADAHFCHRYYLHRATEESRPKGIREFANIAAKFLSGIYERRIYRKASSIVVPSEGLSRELIAEYGIAPSKITVLAPPVNATFREPNETERMAARLELGLAEPDVALLLVSAGDFARKGLAPLIEALADPRLSIVKLFVVGGVPGPQYSRQVRARNLQDRISFCGRQSKIEKFFWAADAFVLPSKYEVFPAVTIEAACSALPLITTQLNGVEEYAVDGITGFIIEECTAQAIADAIGKFLALSPPKRRQMGRNAQNATCGYGMNRFVQGWSQLYSQAVSAQKMSEPQTLGPKSQETDLCVDSPATVDLELGRGGSEPRS